MPLTDAAVRKARPKPTPYKLTDGGGLILLVSPSGSKLWRLRYRRDGRETAVGLGAYPAVGLKEARKAADSHRAAVAAGPDPVVEKRREKARASVISGNTFKAAAEAYVAGRTGWAAGHRKRFMQRMENDVFPVIGNMALDAIQPIDVVSAVQPIVARGAMDSAKRVTGSIGQVMAKAIVLGLARTNPAVGLAAALGDTPPTRNRAAIIDPDELGDFLDRLWEHPHESVAKELLKAIMLTFARPGEVRAMRWADIDMQAAEWTYRVTKIGLDGHIVPLSRQALAIIERMRPLNGRHEYVFALPKTGRPVSDPIPTHMIKRLGVPKEKMTAHGARAIARTHLVERPGYPEGMVELQLSHQPKDVHGRAYNRVQWLAERRGMMQAWADHLDGLRRKHRVSVLGIKALDRTAEAG